MKPPVVIAIVAAVTAATVAGIVARSFAPVGGATKLNHFIAQARAEDAGSPIYFQDPDGKPLYSLTPRKTPDGRDYRGVPAGAEVSFDEPPQTKAAVEPADRRIRHYRNQEGFDGDGLHPRL